MAQTYLAQDLITDAARTILAIASGEPLNPNELSDGLISLNKVVDGWSAIGVLLMQIAETQVSLNALAQPHALSFRPSKILSAACTSGVLSAPVDILSVEEWTQIVDESRSGKFATKLFCDYAFPDSNIFWWPTATGLLHLYYYAPLAQWPDIATTAITLAPGYARALTLNLAVDLAEQYGKPVTQSLLTAAQGALTIITASNAAIFGTNPPPTQPIPQAPGR